MKLLFVLGAAATLCGCRFWYKPVPVADAIGEEETVLAGDTLKVYRERRFEVYGPNPEAVYDGYEQLNRSYRAFERHFGASAPRLAFVLYADSVVPLDNDAIRGFRSRGFTVVQYVRPRGMRSRRRASAVDYGGATWPIAPSAARTMLARFAANQIGGDAPHTESALLERFPAWYRTAVIHLVGEAGAFANDLEYVRDHKHEWWQLRALLTLVRPAVGDTAMDLTRRGDSDGSMRIFAAQASTLGRFLVEQEGPAVLGRLGRGYIEGRALNDVLGEFRTAPRTIPELERRWKAWVEALEN